MDIPDHERAATAARSERALPKIPEAKPAGWGRLGFTAILGLVAGALLFPTPAKGHEGTRPAP